MTKSTTMIRSRGEAADAASGPAPSRAPAEPRPSAGEPFVRLDSLDPERAGRSFLFRGFRRAVTAYTLDEVVPAIRDVERAVAAGRHAAGFLAYEAAPAFEPRFATRPPRADLPLVWFGLFDERMAIRGAAAAPAAGPHGANVDAGSTARSAQRSDPADSAFGPSGSRAAGADRFLDPSDWRASISEADYLRAVERIREWIAAGDTYQVNHTFRLRSTLRARPGRPAERAADRDERALYRRLCRAQRAAYCAYLRLPGFSILSASPELFFRWSDDALELRPMKGTRPRGRWTGEDDALAAELLHSEKERAENLMIVDLLRNDAGRIAEYGSVRVPDLFRLERYPTVHQLTSTVRAQTRPGTTLEEVLRALFPSGSVTGAPKIRTSEIIAELEDSPRGVYTGAIGYVSPDAAAFSVAIRTLFLDRAAGVAELGVGSGITADSVPADEWRECNDKSAFAVHRPAPAFRLLESLRYEAAGAGEFWLLDRHLHRLSESARYFGFRLDVDTVRERLDDAVRDLACGTWKIRLLAAADGTTEIRSVRIADAPAAQIRSADGADAPAAARMAAGDGPVAADAEAETDSGSVRVAVASESVDPRDALLYHKTTRRETYRRRAASRPDCDDVLLVNDRGELTEATTANVVLRFGNDLVTPPIECGLLPGVLRGHLLETGSLRTRRIPVEALRRADGVYLINSVRGWRRAEIVS